MTPRAQEGPCRSCSTHASTQVPERSTEARNRAPDRAQPGPPSMAVAFSPRRLRTAARCGNLKDVQRYVNDGRSVDGLAALRTGASLLFAAAQAGHLPVVEWLIAQGADVELARNDGSTPLLAACAKGHEDCALALIGQSAAVNRCRNSGISPLCAAAQHGHYDVVRTLLASGADVELAVTGGFSALYKACQFGFVPTVEILLAAGADINRAAPDGSTPLLTAAYIGDSNMVRELADHRRGCAANNADVTRTCTAPDGRKFTALQAAEALGHSQVVAILTLAESAPLMGARQRLAWASCSQQRLGHASAAWSISADLLVSVAIVARFPITSTIDRWEGRPDQERTKLVEEEEDGERYICLAGGTDLLDDEEAGGVQGGMVPVGTPVRRQLSLFGKYEHASPRPVPERFSSAAGPSSAAAAASVPDALTPLRGSTGSRTDFPWGNESILSTSPSSVDSFGGGGSSGGSSGGPSGGFSEDEDEPGFPTPLTVSLSPDREEETTLVPLEVLRQGQDLPEGVDRSRKEDYLSDQEFAYVFKLTRAEFKGLPKRMRENAKKQAGLADDSVDQPRVPMLSSEKQGDHNIAEEGEGGGCVDDAQLQWWSEQLLTAARASDRRDRMVSSPGEVSDFPLFPLHFTLLLLCLTPL